MLSGFDAGARRLVLGLGAAALLSAAAGAARAADSGGFAKPQFESHLWLELGGDWEHYTGGDARSFPPSADFPTTGFRPTSGFGYEGRLSYRPADSQRIFALAVRYARADRREGDFGFAFETPDGPNDQALTAAHREYRTVVDFEAGRDVGLGEFDIFSIGALGARYIDFDANTNETFDGTGPDVALGGAKVRRSVKAAGPRIAWHASMPLPAPFDDAGIFLGWDVAGAVLFGSQRVLATVSDPAATTTVLSRSHRAIIPNIEARLNFGWHIPHTAATAKLGVRSEAFYNVLDGGLSTHHALRRVDYGPFLSVVWSLR